MKMQDALRYENGRTICGSNIIVEWAKGAPRAPGVCESNIQPFLKCTRVICVSVKSCICHNSYQLSLAEWFWGWGWENENTLVCFFVIWTFNNGDGKAVFANSHVISVLNEYFTLC